MDAEACLYRQSDEEIKLRKAFLEYERKKTRIKHLNEEGKHDNDRENKDISEDKENKEEDENIEENKNIEDDEEEINNEPIENNQDTQSSVDSGVQTTTVRSFYTLRAAIDEKFIPLSLLNMNYAGNAVFILLLGITIVFFALQLTLYSKIVVNIENINYSEERIKNLFNINLPVINMMIITADHNQYFNTTLELQYDLSNENLF